MSDIIIMECPVCGEKIEFEQWSEYGIGPVEFHISCDNCGYFADMCYSSVYSGIAEGFNEKYKDKVDELGLNVIPLELVP